MPISSEQAGRPRAVAHLAEVVESSLTYSASEENGPFWVGVRTPETCRYLAIRSGVKWTHVVLVTGSQPSVRWSIDHGLLLEVLVARTTSTDVSARGISEAVRTAATSVVPASRLRFVPAQSCSVVGCGAVARAITTLAARGGRRVTAAQISAATDSLAEAWVDALIRGHSTGWYSALLIGCAVMEAVIGCVSGSEIAMI
jgi:hypothetical protein